MSREDIVQYQFTTEQSRSEAAENGRKGGIESGKARRRKRSLKDAADLFLSLPVSDGRRWNKLSRAGVEPEDIDNQMAIIVGLTQEAMAGDPKAAKLLFDLLGEDHREAANETAVESFLQATRPDAETIEELYDDGPET